MEILNAQDFVWIVGVLLAGGATIVQRASKTFKPWTWLAEQFGRAINKDMLDKLDSLQGRMAALEESDKRQDAEQAKQLAVAARRRILRVADEIRKGVRHSEEYFTSALEDVSYYKNYCDEHPDFENSKAVISSKIIEETYKQCLLEDDFE